MRVVRRPSALRPGYDLVLTVSEGGDVVEVSETRRVRPVVAPFVPSEGELAHWAAVRHLWIS